MNTATPPDPAMPAGAAPLRSRLRRWRRPALWAALVLLLVVAQTLLVVLTLSYEASRAQDLVEAAAGEVAADLKQALGRDLQSLQALLWNDPAAPQWRAGAAELLRKRRGLLRIEMRDPELQIGDAVDTPYLPGLFQQIARHDIDLETELACAAAQRQGSPSYSRSYYLPMADGLGQEVVDICLPVQRGGRLVGYLAATLSLPRLLEDTISNDVARHHELVFAESDGARLARAGQPRGAGVFKAERLVDLPGFSLLLRLDSDAGTPRLIPNLATALVLGLSLALASVVLLLARDVRKRALAEIALAEALAFRKAMENSLVTGLRARDLQGRITYVNPAFCEMVGFAPEALIGRSAPPYWPPDRVQEYSQRQSVRLGNDPQVRESARQGFETEFMRRNGERLPVLIFEAPLVDGGGVHAGWMSAVLDLSAQRRAEELSRQQQEKLQATARLATMGEMASLLSHELNQPLAAIASYATGSLNLLAESRATAGPHAPTHEMIREATQRIAEQAERAGRVIRSVHDFVRRRDQAREALDAGALFEAVLPLVRLQARKSGTRIEVDLPAPPPRVVCDRTMLEQVLLNLARNGIQAMDPATPLAERVLTLRVRQTHPRWVTFSVGDRGAGISPEVAQQIFKPFFTTRSDGMGMGLSLCRTVVEQHGGALEFETRAARGFDAPGKMQVTEFRFTLPADAPPPDAPPARSTAAPAGDRLLTIETQPP
jgi:two-component system sensor histidine kinase DctS